jgi:hypothetical protein
MFQFLNGAIFARLDHFMQKKNSILTLLCIKWSSLAENLDHSKTDRIENKMAQNVFYSVPYLLKGFCPTNSS